MMQLDYVWRCSRLAIRGMLQLLRSWLILYARRRVEEGKKLVRSFQDRNFAIDEKSTREHLDNKRPFSLAVWEVIFGKKNSSCSF
jgi:hypothetical protein